MKIKAKHGVLFVWVRL